MLRKRLGVLWGRLDNSHLSLLLSMPAESIDYGLDASAEEEEGDLAELAVSLGGGHYQWLFGTVAGVG